MPAAKGSEGHRVTIYLEKRDVDYLDKMAKRFGCSRSQIVSTWIDLGRADLELLDALGLKPERLSKLLTLFGGHHKAVPDLLKQRELNLEG